MPDIYEPAADAIAGLSVVRELQVGPQHRLASIDRAAVNEDARTVELAFSSEFPVERWFGVETLDHAPTAIRLSRLTNGGALLCDHNGRDQVGVIESVRVGSDRVGRAVVRFGRSARATEILNDVIDGIRRHVSVGYFIHRVVLEEESKSGPDKYRVVDWEPFEVSLVSIPADPSVGVGRSADVPANSPKIPVYGRSTNVPDSVNPPTVAERSADPSATGSSPTAAPAAARQETAPTVPAAARQEPAAPPAPTGGQNDAREIAAIASRQPALRDLAHEFISNGRSLGDFRGAIAERAFAGTLPAGRPQTEIGMTQRDVREFSLVRLARAMMNGGNRAEAAFEFEMSDQVARQLNRQARGVFIPADMLRIMTTSAANVPAAGHLVGTDHASGSFIEMLRPRSVVMTLGARVLSGLVGNLDIPKQIAGSTATWIAEGADSVEDDLKFGNLTLTPKTISASLAMTRRLLLQSSPSVEQLARQDLLAAVARGIDVAAIAGAGGMEPVGILNTSGIGLLPLGTNGGPPTWASIVGLETLVAAESADEGTLAYLTSIQARGKLKTSTVVDGVARFLWDENTINGYRAAASVNVPHTTTKGTGTNLSTIIFGNFADIIVAEWGVIDLKLDEATLAKSGGKVLRVFQDVDIGIRHAASFAATKDMVTV